MTRRRTFGVAAFAAAAALVLAACSSSGSSSSSGSPTSSPGTTGFNAAVSNVVNPSTAKGGTLNFGNSSAPDSTDPGNTYYAYMWNFTRLYTMPLMTYKSCPGACGLQVVPDLATGPGIVSDNGLTWTYHIQPDVKFEDGTVGHHGGRQVRGRAHLRPRPVPARARLLHVPAGRERRDVSGAVQGPGQEPDGPDRSRHAERDHDRVPSRETVRGLQLRGRDPADRPGAAGQGHRRELPAAPDLHRPVHVPELPAEQGTGHWCRTRTGRRPPTRTPASWPARSP